MMLVEMRILAHSLPVPATLDDFRTAIVSENMIHKPTLSSRRKSLHHLMELYGLDTSKALFRVLWNFAHSDFDSLPQLCLVCAFARDPQLRQSFELIRTLRMGEVLERRAMEDHLEDGFPDRFSPAMKKSMAQNVNTTWTMSGHLMGRAKKARTVPDPSPASAAYAVLVGFLSGLRGETLLNSTYGSLVSPGPAQLRAALALASARGLIGMKSAAGIVEFDFSNLLTPAELGQLNEPH